MCNIVGENSNPVYYVGDVTKVKDAKVAVYTCDFDAMGTETKVAMMFIIAVCYWHNVL